MGLTHPRLPPSLALLDRPESSLLRQDRAPPRVFGALRDHRLPHGAGSGDRASYSRAIVARPAVGRAPGDIGGIVRAAPHLEASDAAARRRRTLASLVVSGIAR